jgi:hypothetical protein
MLILLKDCEELKYALVSSQFAAARSQAIKSQENADLLIIIKA